MNHSIRLLAVGCCLLGFGWACHSPDPVVLPVPVVSQPKDTTPAAPAQITAITIEGIPAGNIAIDQVARLITVTVPEVPTLVESAVSVTVTAGYTLYPKGSGYTYKLSLFSINSPLPLYDAGNNEVARYKVTLYQPRPLEIPASEQPLVLATGSPLTVPVKNYYEDNNGAVALLTNTQTGQQLKGSVDGLESSDNRSYVPNQVWATFDADLPQGTYTLDILKNSGRSARSPQVVTVKRGMPRMYVDYWYPFNTYPGGRGVRVTGVNLYAEDQLELWLTNRAGEHYNLTPVAYTNGGKGLTLDLPADLKPAPYAVQFFRKGQPVESYSRLVVRKDIDQPAIESFGDVSLSAAPTQPVVLTRGKPQLFTLIYSPSVASVRLHFIAINNAAVDYLVDAFHTEGYLGFGPDAGYPDFTLPQNMLPGRYAVLLQHVLRNGSVVEGDPLERDIEVR